MHKFHKKVPVNFPVQVPPYANFPCLSSFYEDVFANSSSVGMHTSIQ